MLIWVGHVGSMGGGDEKAVEISVGKQKGRGNLEGTGVDGSMILQI
jgi:hypothetical protein